MRILDVDALLMSPGSIRFRGQEHQVKPIDGAVFKQYVAAREAASSDVMVLAMYHIAASLVPTLTEADVQGMTPEAVGQIVNLALEGVNNVEAQAGPNGTAPVASPAPLPAG